MSIEIPDWVVQLAVDAYAKVNEECGEAVEYFPDAMTEALRAALEGWLVPAGKLPDHSLQRLTTIGTVGWDDIFTMESDVHDFHVAYTLRKDKTP